MAKGKNEKKKKKPFHAFKKFALRCGVGLVLLVAIGALALGTLNASYAKRVYPRVRIGDLAVGGMDQVALRQVIGQAEQQSLTSPIIFTAAGKSTTVKLSDLDFKLDVDQTTDRVFNFGREKNPVHAFTKQLIALVNGYNLQPTAEVNQKLFDRAVSQIVDTFGQGEHNATLKITGTTISEIAEQTGSGVKQEIVTADLKAAIFSLAPRQLYELQITTIYPKVYQEGLAGAKLEVQQMLAAPVILNHQNQQFILEPKQIASWISFAAGTDQPLEGRGLLLKAELDSVRIKSYAANLAKSIDRPAVNAQLKVDNGKVTVFQPSQIGYKVNQDKLAALIISGISGSLGKTLTIPVDQTNPEIVDSQIQDLGLTTLIGTATTSFAGSPSNRVHNITVGTSYINGKLIKPGEEFSTVGALGSVDASTGYLPELVIKEDRTIPEYGGGLCQVSTTLFRSAINAGLPITDRTNHTYRVSYYEVGIGPGLDATIYLPRPDFKFKNDTDHWVLVQGYVKGNNLTFELYGTSDGRSAKITGPYTSNYTEPPAPILENTDQLPKDEQKTIEHAHQGATSVAYYTVLNKDGSTRNQQTFKSVYKALPARIQVGTKEN